MWGCLGANLLPWRVYGASRGLGYLLRSDPDPLVLEVGREMGWVASFSLSMLLLLWLTLVTVETLCEAHVRVVLSLDMGAFLGVPHRRDAALGQLGSVPLSHVSHPISCNLTACIFLPAGTSLACGLCSRRGSVHIVGRLLLLLNEPQRGYPVGALFVM